MPHRNTITMNEARKAKPMYPCSMSVSCRPVVAIHRALRGKNAAKVASKLKNVLIVLYLYSSVLKIQQSC